MTFRSDKHHRVQESSKSTKNVLKLASRLQHFLTTGKASKRDLKAIDDRFTLLLSEQGGRALQLLDQLKEHVPKARGRELMEQTCNDWGKWLARIESDGQIGFSDIPLTAVDPQNALLEAAVDADTDVARMLISFNSSLASSVRKCSYEVPNASEISESAKEILEAYASREKILVKVVSSVSSKP